MHDLASIMPMRPGSGLNGFNAVLMSSFGDVSSWNYGFMSNCLPESVSSPEPDRAAMQAGAEGCAISRFSEELLND